LEDFHLSGTTMPPETTSLTPSSTVSARGIVPRCGRNAIQPEVGFGVVGRKTAAITSLPTAGASEENDSRVMNPTVYTPLRGNSTRTTWENDFLPWGLRRP